MSMICPNCQSENRDGAKFCNECGFPLSGKIAQMAAEAAADDTTAQNVPPADATAPLPLPLENQEREGDVFDVEIPDIVAVNTVDTTNDAPCDNADEREAESAVVGSDVEVASGIDLNLAASMPSSSGPIDPAKLPSIDVAGVNVDENGNAFDFSDIESEDERGADSLDTFEYSDFKDDSDAFDSVSPDSEEVADSFDLPDDGERLVDAGYVAPQASWRSGDTMELPRLDDQPAPHQKEYRAPDPHKKKHGKGKIVAIVALCLVVVAGAAAAVTYHLEMWGGKMLPDVVGRTQSDATYLLEQKGFTVRAMQVKSDETEGIVLLMDPGAGARQEEGTEVVIHVSVARTIPEVLGMQRDEAANLLEEEGFDQVKYVEEKSNEHAGVVLAISPDAGTKAKASDAITVTVAVPFTVPDVAGKTWEEAKTALEAEGYVAEPVYVYDESVTEGTALSSDPAAGSELASGSTVTVSLAKSRGAELEAAALAYLQGAGTVSIGGTTYEIVSVDGVSYDGNETTSFTITGAAVATLDGETVRTSERQRSGAIVWDSANNIVSIG